MNGPVDDSERLKRAVTALRDMRERYEALAAARSASIAVIGMGCRFPGGADDPDLLWDLVASGTDAVTEVPADRWPVDAFYAENPEAEGRMNTRWGAFLDDVRGFDPEFFGITHREAVRMDPQQRILMEVTNEALENAAVPTDALAGSLTGVFLGVHSQSNDYQLLQLRTPSGIDVHTGTGTAHSILANRLSYWLDLQGPSLTVDTACSSSLVAIHLAVMSLRAGESDLALAGGANLILTPEPSVAFAKMRLFAPDGRCKTFDAGADGLVRGEGCGVVVLKRLADAIRDGDRIRGVIAGSAVNQDGRSNGLTAPNGLSQQRVIRRALDDAGVAPADVTFVETHGTGTFLGDPIEVEALAEVLGRSGSQPCTLGALKTNIGHLEGAAGVAGLIKAILALERGVIPPNLHLKERNPHLTLEGTRLRLPEGAEEWNVAERRVAGVSSFGFGGTNAHVVLTEAPRVAGGPGAGRTGPWLLPVSAATPAALQLLRARYADLLQEPSTDIERICATASLGRTHYPHRLAIVAENRDDMLAGLRAGNEGPGPDRAEGVADPDEPRRLTFLYSGQGGQHPGMAQTLLAAEPSFRSAIDECDATFRQLAGWSLAQELADLRPERLERTSVAQPVLFAMQVGLTALLRERGFAPSAVVGHSVGEIAAAWAAGALSLEDATRVVYHRGELIERMAGPGRMAALGLSSSEVAALEGARAGKFSVAAVNGPRSTVISGEPEAVDAAVDELERSDVFVRRLFMAHAFHGPPMEPVRARFVEELAGIEPVASRVDFHSSVTGSIVAGAELGAAYWGRNLREPVDFPAALESAAAPDVDYVEIGPHPLLEVPASRVLGNDRTIIPTVRRDVDARQALHRTAAALHVRGHRVAWESLYPNRPVPASLPSHPWSRKPCWIESPAPWTTEFGGHPMSDTDGVPREWLYEVAWQYRDPPGGTRQEAALPPLESLLGAIRTEAVERTEEEREAHGLPGALDELSTIATVRALRALDWRIEPGERIRDTDLVARHLPRHRRRLLDRLFSILAEAGIARRDGDAWDIVGAPDDDDADIASAIERLAAAHPAHADILELAGRCLPRVADVVRGVADPLDLLFPGGSPSDLRPLYERSPLSRAANDKVLEVVRAARDARGDRPLRILEVGAGTGGTTALLLSELDPRTTEYVFTDVSRAFLAEAQEEFSWFPGLHAMLLDLEGDAQGPDPTRGPFDIVVAANVLHATADVAESLKRLRSRMAPGGVLVLVEGTAPSLWVDLTFGLTEGWWRYEDTALRANHPLIPESAWLDLLPACGFATTTAFEIEGETTGSGFTQSVLLAQAGPAEEAPLGESDPSGRRSWYVLYEEEDPDLARSVVTALGGPDPVTEGRLTDREGLAKWLAESDPAGRGVLVVAAARRARPDGSGEELLAEIAERHQAVVAVVQTLASEASPPRMWILTRGAQAVRSDDSTDPVHAAVWGLGRVVALEEPHVWGGLVDLPRSGGEGDLQGALRPHLLEASGEDQVALRDGARWVARIAPRPKPTEGSFVLRRDGTYVVVGGLGRLGRLFTPWLAERGAGRLALVGRTPLPPRETWDSVAPDSEAGLKIAAVRAAEHAGSEVLVVSADVADIEAMEKQLDEVRRADSPIRGLFHAASFTEFVPSLGAERAAVEATLRSKVVGAWNLHLLEQRMRLELDHFVLFSSVASLLGSRAVGAYAAANQFLDALIHARRAEGRTGLAVVWGGWAGGPESERALLEMNHLVPLVPELAREGLGELIASDAAVRAVANVDWTALNRDYQLGGPRRFLDEVAASRKGDAVAPQARSDDDALRLLEMPPGTARDFILDRVRTVVADVIGLDGGSLLQSDQGFFKLGMDSLMTVELRGRLQRDFHVELPATVALEYPTAERLTTYLADVLGVQPKAGAAVAPTAEAASDSLAELDALGEDELAEQLDDALSRLLDEDGAG